MGIEQDLGRACERVDGPVDAVAGGSPEPFEPVGHPQSLDEGEEAGIPGETMMIVLLDPVVVNPV
jgi:hypothetical protein